MKFVIYVHTMPSFGPLLGKIIIILTVLLNYASGGIKFGRRRPPGFEKEAIERLSRVFGLDQVPANKHHRSPPEYMVNLYHSVAYDSGLTRLKSPYGSNVVRGFPDKGNFNFYKIQLDQN